MRASFFICIAGIAAYLCVLFFYCMKISAKKNAMKKEDKKIQKASASFVSLCGIFGSYLVLKERFEKL